MSDDLISRKELLDEIESFRCSIIGLRAGKWVLARAADEYRKNILRIIGDQPTAFDKQKVIEELNNFKNKEIDMSDEEPELTDVDDIYDEGVSQGKISAYLKAIEIVEKGGKERECRG